MSSYTPPAHKRPRRGDFKSDASYDDAVWGWRTGESRATAAPPVAPLLKPAPRPPELLPSDLRIRHSGEVGVIILHAPTGLSVTESQASQRVVNHVEAYRKLKVLVAERSGPVESARTVPETAKAVPMADISKILAEVMQTASDNGANSVSMPDEYVAVAHFLAYPQEYQLPGTHLAQSTPAAEGLEKIQWRNINKVVQQLATFCSGSASDPMYGVCYLALTNALTAKEGLSVELEPLAVRPQGAR